MVPNSRPKLSTAELHNMLDTFKIDRNKYPIVIIGIRGYYKDSMGKPGVNDRGIYDDALFIDTPNATVAFNGNCDPSTTKPGMANLVAGVYYAYHFGYHKGSYLALVQREGPVKVLRDGKKTTETGYFGINIHKGGRIATGSLGCQTVPPEQWEAFIGLAKSEAKRIFGANTWMHNTIPYVLIEQK